MDNFLGRNDETMQCRGMLHIVAKGDTLYKIGKKYGAPVSRIMYANPYVDVYNLQEGDEICVPVMTPRMEDEHTAMPVQERRRMEPDTGMPGNAAMPGRNSERTRNGAMPGNMMMPGQENERNGSSMPGNMAMPGWGNERNGSSGMPGNMMMPGQENERNGSSMPGNMMMPGWENERNGSSMPGNMAMPGQENEGNGGSGMPENGMMPGQNTERSRNGAMPGNTYLPGQDSESNGSIMPGENGPGMMPMAETDMGMEPSAETGPGMNPAAETGMNRMEPSAETGMGMNPAAENAPGMPPRRCWHGCENLFPPACGECMQEPVQQSVPEQGFSAGPDGMVEHAAPSMMGFSQTEAYPQTAGDNPWNQERLTESKVEQYLSADPHRKTECR